MLVPYYFPFPFLYHKPTDNTSDNSSKNKNNAISNNFINTAIMVVGFYDNAKRNMELVDSYQEMIDSYLKGLKNLYTKFIENEQDRNLKQTFFLSEYLYRLSEQIPKPQGYQFKSESEEEDKDRAFFNMYF